ncbi:DUF3710 domain-containing protein [Ornithinicoccus halotolerans]|uniref:DUF3710 domain-containing protein n=1 Tax=Ornithinicoccus halotolerans TaxID=1748220 RepID=UPI00129639C4|nr:DUF3710 domain-containing protein [Ornithinicoccus halotolerans]
MHPVGIFGRRKQTAATEETEAAAAEEQQAAPPEGQPGVDRDWDREVDGPFDITEKPEPTGVLDLGALKVPAAKGMEMRLDVEKGSGRVVGVTLGAGGSHLQLQAFAAPRSQGLWTELRQEIAESIRNTGGTAEAVPGVLGTELRCRMPGRSADGRTAFQPARFLGVDGPRWFLRGVVHGPAATEEKVYRAVVGLMRAVVVDRGAEPRPPREVLALQPPREVVEAMAKRAEERRAAGDGGGQAPSTAPTAPGAPAPGPGPQGGEQG